MESLLKDWQKVSAGPRVWGLAEKDNLKHVEVIILRNFINFEVRKVMK